MDPLNPMASTLDPAIAQIYSRAEAIKEEMRASIAPVEKSDEEKKRAKARAAARTVLDIPERVRGLVGEGKEEEARKLWEGALRVLRSWEERGVGGEGVRVCIEDGEKALKGEAS